MNLHRLFAMLVVMCFSLAVIATAVADDKAVNKDKIVGDWKLSKSDGKQIPADVLIQLAKDGKLRITMTGPGLTKANKKVNVTETVEGTYKVDGDKLTMELKQRGKEHKSTVTIKTLTDKKLVTVDDRNKEDEFEKK